MGDNAISDFFNILSSVSEPKGAVKTKDNKYYILNGGGRYIVKH